MRQKTAAAKTDNKAHLLLVFYPVTRCSRARRVTGQKGKPYWRLAIKTADQKAKAALAGSCRAGRAAGVFLAAQRFFLSVPSLQLGS